MAKVLEPGRLTEREIRVLIALARGPRHGYAIMKEIEQSTGGRIRVGASSLYPILDRFLARGFIEHSDRESVPEGVDRRRRYLSLTERGREAAAAEVERLEELARQARRVGMGPEERSEGGGKKREHILDIDEGPVHAGAPNASERLDSYVYGSL